jgi:SpoVK/Ycf46/Vps4 family AAA+-type ATPase
VVTDKLLRLPDSRSDDVVAEIQKFWTLKDKFNRYGFSHKRGILLWGPPGSGKTCTISIVMNEMVDAGGIVVLGNDVAPSALAYMLGRLREVEPNRPCVVVLEDIDTIIQVFGESQVLSLLDGESQIANVVYLATTNYPERLDGRIVNRPSRFDRIVKIDTPNKAARLMYLESRDLEIDKEELNRWAEETDGFSIAHLRELIVGVLVLGSTFDVELRRLRTMAKTPKSDEPRSRAGFGVGKAKDEYE